MLTAFVDGDNKVFEFDYGCIGNIAPGQRIRSISIISNVDPDKDYTDVDPNDDDRKYFSVNLAKTDTDPFIPVSGNKNFLIIRLAPTKEEMEVVVNP